MQPRHNLLHITLSALLAASFMACEDQGLATSRVSFWLTDTLGHEQTTFRSGENFLVHLVWVHDSTGAQQGFIMGPQMDCGLWRWDSLLAGSSWGCVFLMADGRCAGMAQDTMQMHWRAPRGLCQEDSVTLTPGTYEARAFINLYFETDPPPQTPPVTFTVRP